MTLSILNRVWNCREIVAIAAVAALAGAGCSNSNGRMPGARTRTVGKLQPTNEPVVVDDEAVELRHWTQSVSYYHSGTTQTFPTRWNYEGFETDSMIANAVIEPTMFVVEAVTYPFRVVQQPPGSMENWAGPVIPPTYTAAPPLPPEQSPPAKGPDPVGDTRRIVHKHVVTPTEHFVKSEQAKSADDLDAKGAPFGAMRDFFRGLFGIHVKGSATAPRSEEGIAPTTEPATTPSPTTTEPATAPTEPATTPATATSPAEGPQPATTPAAPAGQ